MLKACLLVGAAPLRIDLMNAEMEERPVGGTRVQLVAVLLLLRLQLLRQAIALQREPSVPWTTIAAVQAVQAKERIPSLALNAECVS